MLLPLHQRPRLRRMVDVRGQQRAQRSTVQEEGLALREAQRRTVGEERPAVPEAT
jgi:hypothetical protein